MLSKREAPLQVLWSTQHGLHTEQTARPFGVAFGFAVLAGTRIEALPLSRARAKTSAAFWCHSLAVSNCTGRLDADRSSAPAWRWSRPDRHGHQPHREDARSRRSATARASRRLWRQQGMSNSTKSESIARAKTKHPLLRNVLTLPSLLASVESESNGNSAKAGRGSLKRTLYLFALAGGAIGAVSVIGHSLRTLSIDNLHDLVKWFESVGPMAVFYYGGLYYLLELVSFPALMLTIGAGYLFGVWRGLVVSSAAATAAAGTSFLLSRYFLRNFIQEKLASKFPRFRVIDRAVAKEGFKIVLLLRLSPLLPFSASNYLYGITSVRFVPYMLASWLGMLPGTLAYVYAGHTGNAVLESVASRVIEGAATELTSEGSGVNTALLVVGLAATVAVLLLIGRTTSQALKEMDREMAVDADLKATVNEYGKGYGPYRDESAPNNTTVGTAAERAKHP
ncbi:hypothetical protein F1559_002606 [Cyanidiococcus yangmingshanensis]|uniref:VTT domain-containing protein n=1 Tax=Cyanidiococcus yangmingshanensis TaxID=2690220 RepID=A0A7J7IM87_9RHOD|nr:hypothetical protein F1559_002606 [Cyanidiococcus yangmingshanensis]